MQTNGFVLAVGCYEVVDVTCHLDKLLDSTGVHVSISDSEKSRQSILEATFRLLDGKRKYKTMWPVGFNDLTWLLFCWCEPAIGASKRGGKETDHFWLGMVVVLSQGLMR